MPARKTEDAGPWGAAIRYWLADRDMNGADLTRATRDRPDVSEISKNTVGRAIRGAHVNTKTLKAIATVLRVSFEDILVSPEYRTTREEREQLALSITRRVLRDLEVQPPSQDAVKAAADAIEARTKALEASPVKLSRASPKKRQRPKRI